MYGLWCHSAPFYTEPIYHPSSVTHGDPGTSGVSCVVLLQTSSTYSIKYSSSLVYICLAHKLTSRNDKSATQRTIPRHWYTGSRNIFIVEHERGSNNIGHCSSSQLRSSVSARFVLAKQSAIYPRCHIARVLAPNIIFTHPCYSTRSST